MLVALIMAGGKGTRFWPASTEEKPKQFLNLIGKSTMIQETVHRLTPIIDLDHIFICTSSIYKDICLEQLPDLPERNIIVEPIGRNTAPCILLSTIYIKQIYNDTNVIVLPSDHQINNVNEFLNVLTDANEFITQFNKGIITIGISPNRPETGYGYINFLDTVKEINNHSIKTVNKFVEKPNLSLAQVYLEAGNYLWNAGMFMFNVDFMIDEYKKYAKNTYELLASLPPINNFDYIKKLEQIYYQCESISVDFAIMEKTENLFVIPADFGWDDIGSWLALERYLHADDKGNVLKGNVKTFNAEHNIVFSTQKEVILFNADELFVIETDEKIVVGKKSSIEKVYELRGR